MHVSNFNKINIDLRRNGSIFFFLFVISKSKIVQVLSKKLILISILKLVILTFAL